MIIGGKSAWYNALIHTYDFVLDVVEGTQLLSFIGYFDGTRDDMGGPCLSQRRRGIMTTYEIYLMEFN